MENSHFVQLLNSQFGLSENGEKLLETRIQKIVLPKGAPLLRPGEICRHLYFLENGFLRFYRLADEEEHTVDFVVKGHFFSALESLLGQAKSRVGMVCEADTQLYALHYYDLLALEELSLEFVLLGKSLLAQHLLRLNREKNAYRRGSATEKYRYLLQNYPGITAYIKHKDLASYLGIAQQSFSRILKEMLTKG